MRNDEWRLLDLKLSSYAAATPMISTLLQLKSEEKIPNTLALTTFAKSSACLFYYERRRDNNSWRSGCGA